MKHCEQRQDFYKISDIQTKTDLASSNSNTRSYLDQCLQKFKEKCFIKNSLPKLVQEITKTCFTISRTQTPQEKDSKGKGISRMTLYSRLRGQPDQTE